MNERPKTEDRKKAEFRNANILNNQPVLQVRGGLRTATPYLSISVVVFDP